MQRRHFFMILSAVPISWPHGGHAAAMGAAADFVQQIGRELPLVVGGSATEAEKRERLRPFLERVVDVQGLARFCLGRYWRLATPAQKQQYLELFLRALVNAVAARVGIYGRGASKVTMLPEIVAPDGVYVPTVVQTGSEPPVHVIWVVEADARPFRILDVQAEGMSLRQSKRSDYMSFLFRHNNDLDLFLRSLRDHTD